MTPESIKLITEVALAPSRQGKKKRATLPPGEVTLFKEINDFKKAARAYEDDVIIYENFLEMNCKPEA
ncbi:MAG: hypothetical protein JNK65_01610 [Deltaproteobacteria bacterium]|nr:hypothetical protein [Deltaproteobacteria bacterium]